MFMMRTEFDGSVDDCEVTAFSWSRDDGWLRWTTLDGVMLSMQLDASVRIELYTSREAALVDGADVREYPGWGSD